MSIPFSFPSFNPYENQNGGTVVAVAGNDYAIIGADTRLSANTTISTRSQKKLFQLSPVTVLGATGCWCDVLALTRVVKARMDMYQYENGRPMSSPAAAQMLSTVMYYKRFFPYNSATVLAGLDADGIGCVYTFDMIGHFSRSTHSAIGSAGHQLLPVLDNQISKNNIQVRHHGGGAACSRTPVGSLDQRGVPVECTCVYSTCPCSPVEGVMQAFNTLPGTMETYQKKMIELNPSETPVSKKKALSLLKDLFTAAAERDVHTGDSVFILTISKKGVKEEIFALRKD